MAYKVPRLHDVEKDVDPYALEVLSAVLNGYDNARLPRELVMSSGWPMMSTSATTASTAANPSSCSTAPRRRDTPPRRSSVR